MRKNKLLLLLLVGFVLPLLLVYKNFFLPGVLTFGDAPYFYLENLKELFNIPFLWSFRNDNFGAPQQPILWLYLPTFLLGLLNHYLNIDNEVLIRVIFYFPCVILSIVGTWLFVGQFTKNSFAKFFSSIFYTFNSYILTLIDGGQIGIALSYGLFPLASYAILCFWKKQSLKNFLLSLLLLFLLSNTDLRVFIIEIFFIALIILAKYFRLNDLGFNFSKALRFCLLFICLLLVDSFWLIPFITNISSASLTVFKSNAASSNLVSLVDSFFLFQPHFPLNEFGKTFPLPIFFIFLPVLILNFFIFGKRHSHKQTKFLLYISLIYLFFVFLAKGANPPLGIFYQKVISAIPLGFAFRDSSKFFIPTLSLVCLLLAFSIQNILKILKKKPKEASVFLTFIYIYLLFLVYPALIGDLSGVLGKRIFLNSEIKLQDKNFFYRTLWFPEKIPTTFATWKNPALSANDLYKERPFASMTVGSYDLFGFLHSNQLDQWLKLLGVKYVFFPENQRKKIWDKKDYQERAIFLQFIDRISYLKKLTSITTIPVYQIENNLPHILAQKKILIVLGGEQIYNILLSNPKFQLQNQATLFLEQGNFDPKRFLEIDKDSASVILYNRNKNELPFVFLQQLMLSTLDASKNKWAKNSSDDYLKWKASLFEIGINILDFDFGKGISYSTIKDEKIQQKLTISNTGDYVLALRYTNASTSAGIKLKIDTFETNIKSTDPNNFHWSYFEIPNLTSGSKIIEVTNLGGAVVLNTFLLVDKKTYNQAQIEANKLETNLELFNLNTPLDLKNLNNQLDTNFLAVEYKIVDPTKYIVDAPKEAKWLTFTDHYDPRWYLGNHQAYPFYAMVNGFYLADNNYQNLELFYKPQKKVFLGVALSLVTLTIIIVLSLIYYLKIRLRI